MRRDTEGLLPHGSEVRRGGKNSPDMMQGCHIHRDAWNVPDNAERRRVVSISRLTRNQKVQYQMLYRRSAALVPRQRPRIPSCARISLEVWRITLEFLGR